MRHPGSPPDHRIRCVLILLLAIVIIPFVTLRPAPVQATGAYYVATSGSDASGTGSLSNPWRTIQKAANAVGPGSTVLIQPGTYHDAVEISITGTAGSLWKWGMTCSAMAILVSRAGCAGFGRTIAGRARRA